MTMKNKRIEWKARYTTWKERGKSVAEWCRNEEITLHQMYDYSGPSNFIS